MNGEENDNDESQQYNVYIYMSFHFIILTLSCHILLEIVHFFTYLEIM